MNPNDPVFPSKYDSSLQNQLSPKGLTKREYFAAMALNGTMKWDAGNTFDVIAENAARMADALIEELLKETK